MKKYMLFITSKEYPHYYRPCNTVYTNIEEALQNVTSKHFIIRNANRHWILLDTNTFKIVCRGFISPRNYPTQYFDKDYFTSSFSLNHNIDVSKSIQKSLDNFTKGWIENDK